MIADMKIGGLTACGPTMTLEDWMKEAKRIGLDVLEVAAFERGNVGDVSSGARKDYVADTINVDIEPMTEARAREILTMSRDYGVGIHSLGSFDNHLHPATGASSRDHFKRAVDAAKLLEVKYLSTFVGADPNIRMQENFELFVQQFIPLIAYAKERGVRVQIENCPMEGWEQSDRPVNNIMSSPRYWKACFAAAEAAQVGDAFGLEYDPSHRIWQLAGRMDLVAKDVAYFGSKGKIFTLHGKGAELKDEGLWEDGIDGRLIGLPPVGQGGEWAKRSNYSHAVPGQPYDSVNWSVIIPMARAFGVPAVIIEIEDGRFKDMRDPVQNGILGVQATEIGRKNLAALCYANGINYQATGK